MKAETVRKYLKKLIDGEPVETGCRFHGNVVPVELVIECDKISWTITRDRVGDIEVDGDSIVLWEHSDGGAFDAYVAPLSSIYYIKIVYGSRK